MALLPALTFSFPLPFPLFSLPESVPVLSRFPFPPFLSVTCSYWSLLLTGGLWLILAIFLLSAWVHSAPAASVSSCLILIPVCESLALHFLPSPQKWLFFPFICVCVCLTACSQSYHCCIPFFVFKCEMFVLFGGSNQSKWSFKLFSSHRNITTIQILKDIVKHFLSSCST